MQFRSAMTSLCDAALDVFFRQPIQASVPVIAPADEQWLRLTWRPSAVGQPQCQRSIAWRQKRAAAWQLADAPTRTDWHKRMWAEATNTAIAPDHVLARLIVPPHLQMHVPPYCLDDLFWVFTDQLHRDALKVPPTSPPPLSPSVASLPSLSHPDAASPFLPAAAAGVAAARHVVLRDLPWGSPVSPPAPAGAAAMPPAPAAAPAPVPGPPPPPASAWGLTRAAAILFQRRIRNETHARINRARHVRIKAAAAVGDAEAFNKIRYQWHVFCAGDVKAGVDLTKAGLPFGARQVEIRWCDPAQDAKVGAWAAATTTLPEDDRDVLRMAGIDPGQRTWLMIYLLHPNCQIRIGHGEAEFIDMRFAQRRRRLQSELDVVRKRVLAATDAAAVKAADVALLARLPQEMRLVQLEQDRHVKRLHELAARILAFIAPAGVLSPNYRTSQMRKVSRRLSAKITRLMGHLRHHDFCMMLESRCHTSNVPVGVFSEAYTTAICSQCGFHNRRVGGAKTFVCSRPACGHVECRDGGGAMKFVKKCLLTVNTHYSLDRIKATFPIADSRPRFTHKARYGLPFPSQRGHGTPLTAEVCAQSSQVSGRQSGYRFPLNRFGTHRVRVVPCSVSFDLSKACVSLLTRH